MNVRNDGDEWRNCLLVVLFWGAVFFLILYIIRYIMWKHGVAFLFFLIEVKMDDKEIAKEIAEFNPVTDTGRALKFFMEWQRKKHEEENGHYQDLSADIKEIRRMKEEERKKEVNYKTFFRGLWDALWHGLGVTKAEGDKLFKS